MQVICMDGTVLQCQRFEAIDSGVLLFGEPRQSEAGEEEDEDEETETREEATAFVPIHQLRFVLPEGIQPGGTGAQSVSQSMPQGGPGGPPMAGSPRQGQMPPQQSTGGQPSPPPQGRGQPPSQSGTGRRQ